MTVAVDVVFCDEIRTEVTGKIIAIGVYGNELIVHNPDGQVFLTLWVRFLGLEPGVHENRLCLHFNDELVLEAEGEIDVNQSGVHQVFLQGVALKFVEDGILKLSIAFKNGLTVQAPTLVVNYRPK